jgi:hypothetical protein
MQDPIFFRPLRRWSKADTNVRQSDIDVLIDTTQRSLLTHWTLRKLSSMGDERRTRLADFPARARSAHVSANADNATLARDEDRLPMC